MAHKIHSNHYKERRFGDRENHDKMILIRNIETDIKACAIGILNEKGVTANTCCAQYGNADKPYNEIIPDGTYWMRKWILKNGYMVYVLDEKYKTFDFAIASRRLGIFKYCVVPYFASQKSGNHEKKEFTETSFLLFANMVKDRFRLCVTSF